MNDFFCRCEVGDDCTKTSMCAIQSALEDQSWEYEAKIERLTAEWEDKHEICKRLTAEVNVLKTAMGDAVCEIADRDYENAKEVLEFALAGHVPVSVSGRQDHE